MLGRRQRFIIGAVAGAVLLVGVAVFASGGDGGGEQRADTVTSSTTAVLRTTTSSSTSTTSTTTTSTSTTTPSPPPTPPPPPAAPVAVDQARLERLRLPDESCDDIVDGDVSRQLVGGESRREPYQLIELLDWAAGDLDGDGVADAVARIGCSVGGSGYWMEAIAVFAAREAPLRIDVEHLVPSYYELHLRPFAIVDGVLELQVGSSTEYDPHCCTSVDTELALVFDGDAFDLVSVTVKDAASMSSQLAAAVNAGDDATLAAISTPDVAAAAVALRASGGDLRVDDSERCRDRFEVYRLACVLRAADGSAMWVGWRQDDFFVWVADEVEQPA